MNSRSPFKPTCAAAARARAIAIAATIALAGTELAGQSPLPLGASPGFLIVAPQAVVDAHALDAFVAFKTGLGFRVFAATTESIAAGAPAFDFGEQVREYLKRAHRENTAGASNVRYVLLIGDIPIREIYPKSPLAACPSPILRPSNPRSRRA